MVRAMQRLSDNAHAVLAGAGRRRAIVEELAGALGVRERVHFSGLVRDILAFLSRVDLYVQSSHWGGLWNGRLQVLVSDVRGLAVVVDDDDYRLPAKNHGQLAAPIRELASDDEKYGNATAYARRRAQGFSIDRTVSCYEVLYELIKPGPPTMTTAGADIAAPRFRRSSRPSQDLR